ncbi:MAG: hypothetical protein AAF541_10465 [Pseudomonadota bacterium]
MQFAMNLLEVTIRENRAAMDALASSVADISDDLHCQIDGAGYDLPNVRDHLNDIVKAMQCHDITDQRLMHVLEVLQNDRIEASTVFTQPVEYQIWEATQENNSFSAVMPQHLFPTSSDVELFD